MGYIDMALIVPRPAAKITLRYGLHLNVVDFVIVLHIHVQAHAVSVHIALQCFLGLQIVQIPDTDVGQHLLQKSLAYLRILHNPCEHKIIGDRQRAVFLFHAVPPSFSLV